MKLAFKIDVDTYQGTKIGVENFRRFFGAEGIRPTFLFSLGKDQMGRSIFRVFKKGFIRKCLINCFFNLFSQDFFFCSRRIYPGKRTH